MENRIRSIEHDRWAARDGRRAVLAAMLLIFVAATSFSDGRLLPDFNNGSASLGMKSAPDDDLRTGSILITPPVGNICERRLIDNVTWRIHPDGPVKCDAAVAWRAHSSGEYTSQSRLEVIREGFVSRR